MAIDLNETNIAIDDPNYREFFADLQGNVLKAHGRDHSLHIFLHFKDGKACRKWLSKLADSVTSTTEQYRQSEEHKALGTAALFTGVMLTATGYRALAISEELWPADTAWRAGMKDLDQQYDTVSFGDHRPQANPLKDEIEEWEEPFQQEIHALILLAYAGRELSDREAQQHLHRQAIRIQKELSGIGEIVLLQQGHVMRNTRGQVIEHFGFADGISNPLFMKDELHDAFTNGGYSHFDPSGPLNIVLVKDPGGCEFSYGSYLVYRKLQQNAKGFWERSKQLAAVLSHGDENSVSAEYAASLSVGRFPDGTPLAMEDQQERANPYNNFNYDSDCEGARCPFHAHIRKTNPRNDTVRQQGAPPTLERSRRIVRRGISYGSAELMPDEEWADAGLLFLSLQSNIEQQFIFMQNTWCNNDHFVKEQTGIDPIIGKVADAAACVSQEWPARYGTSMEKKKFRFSDVVRTRGGEYFFVPSISFLKNL